MDLKQHLLRQMAFSHATFGPGRRTKGICDHIRKELDEVEESGGDITEWIDVVILALDGATRAEAYSKDQPLLRKSPTHVAALVLLGLLKKQADNEARNWPDWRTMDRDKAIEHIRTEDEKKQKKSSETSHSAAYKLTSVRSFGAPKPARYFSEETLNDAFTVAASRISEFLTMGCDTGWVKLERLPDKGYRNGFVLIDWKAPKNQRQVFRGSLSQFTLEESEAAHRDE